MNDQDPNSQLDALFASARKHRPDTSAAEFAFETRLLARLRAQKQTSSVWAMVSWRLIPFFAACVVAPPRSSLVTSSCVTALITSGPVMNM